MFKEKKAGFLYLFSDKEIRGIAVLTFTLAAFLVSIRYLFNIVSSEYVFVIAIISYVVFQYLFMFFLMFNIWRLFGAFSDKRKDRKDRKNLWAIRLLAGGLVAVSDLLLLFVALIPFVFLMVISFIIWCAMEAFFLCKLAAELASFTHRRFSRFLLYMVFITVFGIYSVYSLWNAVNSVNSGSTSTLLNGLDTTWFDWALTLVLFVFSFASMGERFLAAEQLEKLDFDKLSGMEGARIRSTVVFLLFTLLGFQMFVRGFDFISILLPLAEFGTIAYYSAKLFFFVLFSIGFMFAVIVKQIRKVPGKE